ncbi:hypothetical protein chiPu_0032050, partial [Chiloscyllium punctatum]|nr:hypothetical protein [Chiloscyllium punctatum]
MSSAPPPSPPGRLQSIFRSWVGDLSATSPHPNLAWLAQTRASR